MVGPALVRPVLVPLRRLPLEDAGAGGFHARNSKLTNSPSGIRPPFHSTRAAPIGNGSYRASQPDFDSTAMTSMPVGNRSSTRTVGDDFSVGTSIV